MVIFGAGRAVSRSSRARAVLVGRGGGGGGGISAVPQQGANRDGGSIGRIKENLGFLRGYLSSIGANRGGGGGGFVCKAYLLDWNRRMFSNSENFHSKQENGNTTGNEQNSQSNGDDNDEEADILIWFIMGSILIVFGSYLIESTLRKAYYERQLITFEEFKTKLLEPGSVNRIVVSNKSLAKVYLRSSPHNARSEDDVLEAGKPTVEGHGSDIPNESQYEYSFYIDSVESFKDKMQESQELLVAGFFLLKPSRKKKGGGGKGGSVIWKANTTKVDKNA